jgi:hypothetical protein
MRCRQTDHGFESSDCHRARKFVLVEVSCLLSNYRVKLGCILDTVSVKLGSLLRLHKAEVLLKEISSDNVPCYLIGRLLQVLFKHLSSFAFVFVVFHLRLNHVVVVSEVEVSHDVSVGVLVSVICNNALCNFAIVPWVFVIEHNKKQIESGEKRIRESNVLSDGAISCILAENRVCCGNN